jgi:glucose-6-phosphate isomerase
LLVLNLVQQLKPHHRKRFFEKLFIDAKLNPKDHYVIVVTDPNSPLDISARCLGIPRRKCRSKRVGGRFSAFSAFGLVPAAIMGVDVSVLLDDAESGSTRHLPSQDSTCHKNCNV